MCLGSFLRNLEWQLLHKIMVAERDIFSWSAWDRFAKGKVVSKCKIDNPCKN